MQKLLLSPPPTPTCISAYLPLYIEDVEEFELEEFTIPNMGKNCQSELCKEVFNRFRNRKTRIIHHFIYYVVPFAEWSRLCSNCKRSFYNWYYEDLLHASAKDKMPFEVFEIEIEKGATWDLLLYLDNIVHYSSNDADREDIIHMRRNIFESCQDVGKRCGKKAVEMGFTLAQEMFHPL
jgi:hypothetical protein